MPRHKKDMVKFSSSMDRTLFDKVQEHSEETGLPINIIIAKALKMYFEAQEKKKDKLCE